MGDMADDLFDMALLDHTQIDEDPPEIEFDEESHTYRVDGKVKRSVTTILKDAGICDYTGVDEYYRDRGTRAHDACTLYAQGFLDWSSVASDILPFVTMFKSIVEHLGLSYVSSEEPCYDPEYDVCGKYDLIMKDNSEVLVELKTGDFKPWAGLQLASYQRMTGCERVMGISLKDGKVWVPAPDWARNHEELRKIHNGGFDLALWKSDRKRRRMILKEVA